MHDPIDGPEAETLLDFIRKERSELARLDEFLLSTDQRLRALLLYNQPGEHRKSASEQVYHEIQQNHVEEGRNGEASL